MKGKLKLLLAYDEYMTMVDNNEACDCIRSFVSFLMGKDFVKNEPQKELLVERKDVE